jgi:hypothetical protein
VRKWTCLPSDGFRASEACAPGAVWSFSSPGTRRYRDLSHSLMWAAPNCFSAPLVQNPKSDFRSKTQFEMEVRKCERLNTSGCPPNTNNSRLKTR